MKHCFTILTSLLISSSYSNAQNINIIEGVAYLNLNTDLINSHVAETHPLVITNKMLNFSISGDFASLKEFPQDDYYVAIIARPNTSIGITELSSTPPQPASGQQILPPPKNGTTVIRIGSTGTGRSSSDAKNSNLTIISYPNPVDETITIDTKENKVIHYSIYDVNGILKLSQKIDSQTRFTASVSDFIPGNYIIKLEFENTEDTSIQFIKR